MIFDEMPKEVEVFFEDYCKVNAVEPHELLEGFRKHLGEENFNAYKGTEVFDTLFKEFTKNLLIERLGMAYDALVVKMKEYPEHQIPQEFTKEFFVNITLSQIRNR